MARRPLRPVGPCSLLVACALLLGMVLAGGTPAESVRGVEVYRANYCGACHTFAAAGSLGTFGPSHDGMATVAGERLKDPAYTGAATTPADYLRESILDPSAYLVPGYLQSTHAMPAFVHLNEEDLEALVALLLAH